jgi:hypothetical protein
MDSQSESTTVPHPLAHGIPCSYHTLILPVPNPPHTPVPLDPSERVPRAAVDRARLTGVVVVEGGVIMTPHGHVLVCLSLFVGLGSRRDSPTLQSALQVRRTAVLINMPVTVDPVLDFVDGNFAEANLFHWLRTSGIVLLASACLRYRHRSRRRRGVWRTSGRGFGNRLPLLVPRATSILTSRTPFLKLGRLRRRGTRWMQTSVSRQAGLSPGRKVGRLAQSGQLGVHEGGKRLRRSNLLARSGQAR